MPDGQRLPDGVSAEIENAEHQKVQQQTPVVPEQQAFSVFKRPDQAQPLPDTQTAGEGDTITPQDEFGQVEGDGTGQTEQQTPQVEQLTPQDKSAYEQLAKDNPALYKVLEMSKESIYQHIQEKDDLEDWQVKLIQQRFAKNQPKDLVEYVTKLRMLKELQQEYGLSNDKIIDWERAFDEMTVAEVQQYMSSGIHSFIAENYQLNIRGETDDDSEEVDTPTEPAEKANEPIPFEPIEQVEVAGEDKTKEAELTAQAAKTVEQMVKVTALKEYAKRYPAPQEPQEFLDADKKVPNPNYEAEKQLHQAVLVEYRKAFEQFWQKKYLPRVKAEQAFIKQNPKPPEKLPDGSDNPEYAAWAQKLSDFSKTFDATSTADASAFDEQGKTLVKELQEAGLDFLLLQQNNTDLITTFKAIFGTHDLYRAAHINWTNAKDNESGGKLLSVLDFKELMSWSSEKEEKENNKKRWMLLCALIGRKLSGSKLATLDPNTWIEAENLNYMKIKEHMKLFHEECLKAGKNDVDKALKKALEDASNRQFGDIAPRSTTDRVQVSAVLMGHIQMMGSHHDFVQNFFGD